LERRLDFGLACGIAAAAASSEGGSERQSDRAARRSLLHSAPPGPPASHRLPCHLQQAQRKCRPPRSFKPVCYGDLQSFGRTGKGSVTLATHSRTGSGGRKKKMDPDAASLPDLNMIAAGLLHDMAAVQSNQHAAKAYKRAAKAVIGLPMLVSDLVQAGTLAEVPFIGPSSARIVIELVETAASRTVDAAV